MIFLIFQKKYKKKAEQKRKENFMPRGRAMRAPNGYGSVTKLSGKRRRPFMVKVDTVMDERGYPKSKILGYFATREEANIALLEYHKNPYNPDTKKLSFLEVYELWFESKYIKGVRNYSQSSIQATKAALKKCEPLYHLPMKEIRTLHMQNLLDSLSCSHASIEFVKVLLSQVSRYALQFDIIEKDYAAFVKIQQPDDDEHGIAFSLEDIKKLWDHVDLPWVDSILIYIHTGWRANELLQMPIENIDLFSATMRGGLKTVAGKNRLVPIHEDIFPLIKARMKKQNVSLFGPQFMKYSTYRNIFYRTLKTVGITTHYTLHDCRHTFETLLNNAGANDVAIDRLMGHSSKGIGKSIYTHKDLTELRKAVSLINTKIYSFDLLGKNNYN